MATHFSILAWEIPWMEESGELQSTGLQRVGHNLMTEQVHKRRLSLVYLDSLVATNLGPSWDLTLMLEFKILFTQP